MDPGESDDRSVEQMESGRQGTDPHGGSGRNDGDSVHYTSWDTDGRTSWNEDRDTGRVSRDHDR